MHPTDESTLALHIQEGRATDPAIAALLVQQFAPGVQQITQTLLNGLLDSHGKAQEITRQTFAAALNDPESFMGKEDIRAWLYARAMRYARAHPDAEQALIPPPSADELFPGLTTLPPKQYLALLLRYGHRLPLPEIAHLLRASERQTHTWLALARENLISHFRQPANQQTNQLANQRALPYAVFPHFPRETQRLLDHLLDPEAEAKYRTHLETCPDCRTHLNQFLTLENQFLTRLYQPILLPEAQIQTIVKAVVEKDFLPPAHTRQLPAWLTHLPVREIGWVVAAAIIFLVLARWLNPHFTSPAPPRKTPTPAPAATIPPPQALSTVFRELNAVTTSFIPTQHTAWTLIDLLTSEYLPTTPFALSPDGEYAAFGRENAVLVWSLQTDSQRVFEGHTAEITSVAIFPEDDLLLSSDTTGLVLIWSLTEGRVRFRLEGHLGPINALALSPDHRFLVLAHDEGLWIWTLNDHSVTLIQKYPWPSVRLVTFSPEGKYLTAADAQNTVIFWHFPDGKFLLRYDTLPSASTEPPAPLTTLAYSPDGKKLATGSYNGTVEIVTLAPTTDGIQGTRLFALPHPARVSEVRWSPDGTLLAVVADSGTTSEGDAGNRAVYLWNTETGTLATAPLAAQVMEGITHVFFGLDGNQLWISNESGEIFIWDREDLTHLIAAVPEPQFFTRAETDLLPGPLPADTLPIPFTDPAAASFNFTPFALSSPFQQFSTRYTFLDGHYSVKDSIIALRYLTNAGDTFTLTQRLASDELPAVGTMIGASAVIQPVQIQGTMGEYITGSWALTFPDNPDGVSETPLYRWQSSSEQRLRWEQAGLLMEIRAPLYALNADNLTMHEMTLFAENLVAQTVSPLLYTYTIQDGDTCTGIAQRYGTTVARIAEVNGLDNCDLIVAGQPLKVPLPTALQTVTEVDLDCDGQLERIRGIPDPTLADLSASFGVVVETIPDGGNQYWPFWRLTIADVPAVFIGLPQIYQGGECEIFLGVSIFAGESEISGLDLYRWDEGRMEKVLDANGFVQGFSPPGTAPFQITTQSLVRDPAAGGCTRTTTTYEWNSTEFIQLEEFREEGVACLDG